MPRYAAVDIGSNSVRMMVAEPTPEGLSTIAQDRQVTRIGASVFLDGRIHPDTIQNVSTLLERIAQSFQTYQVEAVRAVATSALRDASNQGEFLAAAQQALGTPIEIISGQEEARLIHLGVEARWPEPEKRRLFIDVGGGSTEFVLSDRGAFSTAYSKPLGAVRLTEVLLKQDPPSPVQLRQLNEFIDQKLADPVRCIEGPFDRVVATSASAGAIVCAVNGISRGRRDEADRIGATTAQVRSLHELLSKLDLGARRMMPGIGPRRAELMVAGTAVFLRSLEAFGQQGLFYSIAGVRDGVIADLSSRISDEDGPQLDRARREAVATLSAHYKVQPEHAHKVADLAADLFAGLRNLHGLPRSYGAILEAAAYLHDIGHYVTDTGHHKHSHYLVMNSELPGFTSDERALIAALCRYHRKTLPALRHGLFEMLDPQARRAVVLLTPLLRLADNLDRSHEQKAQSLRVEVRDGRIEIGIRAHAEFDLEEWAAQQAVELLGKTYEMPAVLLRR